MKRSLKFSLGLGNTGKLEVLEALYTEYASLVNYYLGLFPERNAYVLSEEVVQAAETPLSARYRQCAARQATMIWKAWRRTWRPGCMLPTFTGTMQLDQRFLEVEVGENSFDYWVNLSTKAKRQRISLPFKSYAPANRYFDHWTLRKGGKIQKCNGTWFLFLCFEKPTPPTRETGEVQGIDIGYRKLIITSDGKILGRESSRLAEKIARKRVGSKRWKKASTEMQHYVNRVVKPLFTPSLRVLVLEKLKHLKRKKRGVWSRRVNRLFNFWLYGHLIRRLYELGELHGVRVVAVNAAYTSQTCPECGHCDALNRRDEAFECVHCGFAADADYVGAVNVRSRFAEPPIVARVSAS